MAVGAHTARDLRIFVGSFAILDVLVLEDLGVGHHGGHGNHGENDEDLHSGEFGLGLCCNNCVDRCLLEMRAIPGQGILLYTPGPLLISYSVWFQLANDCRFKPITSVTTIRYGPQTKTLKKSCPSGKELNDIGS